MFKNVSFSFVCIMKKERSHIALENAAVFAADNMILSVTFFSVSHITTTTATTTITPMGV